MIITLLTRARSIFIMNVMISCILLSAGLSQRFGSPKALVPIDGTTIIGKLQKTLIDSQAAEIIIVLGAYGDEIKSHILNHKKVRFVYNKDYILGQTSSFQKGLTESSSSAKGFCLVPVDYPFLLTATIDVLIGRFEKAPSSLLIPTYDGKKGHPPIFHCGLKKELLALKDSVGLNQFQRNYASSTVLWPVTDRGVILTFNTREEWESLVKENS